MSPPIPDDRPLTAAERSLLFWLLGNAAPRGRTFLAQIDHARVVSRCGCGCASVDFSVGGRKPPPEAGLEPISETYYWIAPRGGRCGVFAYAKDELLAGLELYSVDGGETPVDLPTVDELRQDSV